MRISDWSSDVCSSDLGGFQPSVIKAKALARAILEVKLTIVAIFQRIMRQPPGAFGIKRTVAVQEFADIVNFGGCISHATDIGRSARLCHLIFAMSLRNVGKAAELERATGREGGGS